MTGAATSGRSTASLWKTSVVTFKPRSENVVLGSGNLKVQLLSYISFVKIWILSESGATKLKALMQGQSNDLFDSGGLALGSICSPVVTLKGLLPIYVYQHYREYRLSDVERDQRIATRNVWFGIVDKCHCNEATAMLV